MLECVEMYCWLQYQNFYYLHFFCRILAKSRLASFVSGRGGNQQGSTFPGAQGHMPLDFVVGP